MVDLVDGEHAVVESGVSLAVIYQQLMCVTQSGKRAHVDGCGDIVCDPLNMASDGLGVGPVAYVYALIIVFPGNGRKKRGAFSQPVEIFFVKERQKFPRVDADNSAVQTGLQVFLQQETVVLQQHLGCQVVPYLIGNDFVDRVGFETVEVLRVDLHCGEIPGMCLQQGIGPDAVQNRLRIIAEDVVSEWIDFIFAVEFFEPGEKTCRQVAVPNAPFLDKSGFPYACKTIEIVLSQAMGEPVVQADIGLEMVVDTRPVHSIKKGVDVGLPLVCRFEVSKGQYMGGTVVHGGADYPGGVCSTLTPPGMPPISMVDCCFCPCMMVS